MKSQYDEELIWGWEEGHILQPQSAPRTGMSVDMAPGTQPSTLDKSQPPSPAPLWDIEICTPL